jgi:hypothetical protein
MTDYSSIALKPYNALFSQLYTERGSLLLNVDQLEWLADNADSMRIAASQLRRLQDEKGLISDDPAPDTKRSCPSSIPPEVTR